MKQHIWRRVVAALIVTAATPAAAEEIKGEARSGQPVMIQGFKSSVGEHCGHGPLPLVTVTRQPGNGVVDIRRATFAGDANMAGSGRCLKQKALGVAIYYTSRKGFRGTETVAYTVTFLGGQYPLTDTTTAIIAVK